MNKIFKLKIFSHKTSKSKLT